MNNIDEIKITYIMITIVMMFFVGFIIFVVLLYNKKQHLYQKERQLKESEFQNQLLHKELEKQKLIELERERISHDMHDDLGAGISALKLQAEFLLQKSTDEDLKTDIDELLKTSEEMNTSMREMLWSLNSGNDTVRNFVEYSKLYATHFLKKTKIHLTVEEVEILDTLITTEQRRNLFLCLKEALNNAYKHSKSDQLKISFLQKDKIFIMEISDNGIGINQEKQSGNGLRNMKRRMNEQYGTFEISTNGGTHLVFTLNL